MSDISFILPTNRDPSLFSKKVISNINSLNFFGKTHEIIVVSPKEISGENVIYVKEGGDNNGCVGGYNVGYENCTGDYIFLCSDDHYFDSNCSKIIDVLESRLFKDRKYKVACLPTNGHGPCALPAYCDTDGIIARYPVFARDTIEKHLDNYIYHPSFRHHYPDNWLGFWLSRQGEAPIEINRFDMVTFKNSCEKMHDDYDESIFRELMQNYNNGAKGYVK